MVVPILDPTEPLRITIGGTTRDEPVAHHRNDGPDHLLGVQDFLESIRDGREPVINSAHALHVVAVPPRHRGRRAQRQPHCNKSLRKGRA